MTDLTNRKPKPIKLNLPKPLTQRELERRIAVALKDYEPKMIEEYVENGIVIKRYEAR